MEREGGGTNWSRAKWEEEKEEEEVRDDTKGSLLLAFWGEIWVM